MINELLFNVLEGNYDQLSIGDLRTISKHLDLFGLKKDFIKLVDIAEAQDSLAFNLSGDTTARDRINDYLKEQLPSRTEILDRVDNKYFDEPNFKISFRKNFLDNLRKMDALQLCYTVDKIGYYIHKKHGKFYFFGDMQHQVGAYHEINKAITKSFGTTLIFNIFDTKNNTKEKFLNIDYQLIDKDSIVQCLEDTCIRHFYVLEKITEVILNFDESNLKNTTHVINKEIAYFKGIIEEGRLKSSSKGKMQRQSEWQLFIDDYYYLSSEKD